MENVIRNIRGVAIYQDSSHLENCRLRSADGQCVADELFSFKRVKHSTNVDWWSFKIDVRDLSWTLPIVLFSPLAVNIQIRVQYQKWDTMKDSAKFFLSTVDVKRVLPIFLNTFLANVFQMNFENKLINSNV